MTVTLEEALHDLWSAKATTSDRARLTEQVASAAGVGKPAASAWLRGARYPKGVTRINLLVYLVDELDLQIEEFVSLDPRVQQLHRMLVDGVFDLESLTTLLEYANQQDTLRLLRGITGLSGSVEERVAPVIEAYAPNDQVSPSEPPADPGPARAVPATRTTPSPLPCGEDAQAQVLRVSGLLLQLLPDLEALASSDDSSLHESLRRTVGDQRFVELSTMMNALTGPRPMANYKSIQHRKGSAK